ncbi:MAG: DUF177 domain-containing protein [Clostridia bacterium]|nr:DUF177 domain-containing protein [Clostridia bacterium]
MKLDVSQALKNQGQSYRFKGELTLPGVEVMGDEVSFGNVEVDGEYIAAEEAVSVSAKVKAVAKTRCCLCLSDVELPISTKLKATYMRQPPPDDPDVYPLDGYMADIDMLSGEALILELPMRIVCREDCKGLCPTCGVNRNVERCICQEGGDRLNPFSALTEMLSKNEEV